jgi:hypothetical protein
MRLSLSAILVGLLVLVTTLPANASTPPFRQQASHLCEGILSQIKQTPAGKPFAKLTRLEADRFLGSASTAFGTLARKLGSLQPPQPDQRLYGAMLTDFRASSRAFAQAKRSFEQGDKAASLREATNAAKRAGAGAAIGKTLRLGQCGP